MADPISITALIVDVSQILARLINYAKAVQGAKSDMRKLSEELFTLKGILEHMSKDLPKDTPEPPQTEKSGPFNREVMARVLHTTNEFLQSLIKDLERPATKFQRLKQKLEWPFTQDEMNAHLAQLERVKSWLILVLMSDHASVDREMQRDMDSLANALREDLQVRDQERSEIANRELLQWIAPESPANAHLRASKGQKIGTGRWFIDGYLKTWIQARSDNERLLVLVGKSGTGKTTLFAQTVDELATMASRDPALCVAYYYCMLSNNASQAMRNLLGSLVAQLSRKNPSLLDNIRSIYDQNGQAQAHRPPIETTALEDAIIKCASGRRQVLILIDAINESYEMEHIKRSLLRLAEFSPNIRILVTTTVIATVEHHPRINVLNISAEMMRGDIDAFIKYRLEQDDSLKDLPIKLKAGIESTLLQKADGSFRWVQLSLDNLTTQRTAKSMRMALQNLPETLRETYANTLERIAPDDWKLVREALFWLCFVKTPLTLRDLNEAVVVEEDSTSFDEDMMLLPPNLLLHIGQGLIMMDEFGCVNLAHSSVKEFLTSAWIRTSRVSYFSLDPATADATIMRRCLSYLSLNNFKSGYSLSIDGTFTRLETYQFLSYATYFWPTHGAACELGDRERRLVNKFFDSRYLNRRGNFGVWIETLIPGADAKVIEMTQPLYYAASFGMVAVIKAILASDSNININAPGGRVGATALFAACWRHNYEAADILLQAGADPTITDPGTGTNVLGLAKMRRFSGLKNIVDRWKAQRRD